jgi:translocator assembly and maintenance protein 41
MMDEGGHTRDYLSDIVATVFPEVQFAFAYGSGAIKQKGYGDALPMIDFIFGVTNAVDWHAQNIEKNASHYSFLKYGGASSIVKVQKYGPGLYYNPSISVPHLAGQEIKYGIVDMDDLLTDLVDWRWLYASGRMHKPVD